MSRTKIKEEICPECGNELLWNNLKKHYICAECGLTYGRWWWKSILNDNSEYKENFQTITNKEDVK